MLLRRIAATAGAIVVGLLNTIMHARESVVELKAGDPAPDFSLQGSDGQTYRLKELVGHPVVIAWFPKAFTGGCTAECRSLAANGETLKAGNVRFFAASVDSVDANRRFAESLQLSYPILSDPTKEVARAYGVLAPSGFASRWTFYIGADGGILDIDKQVIPQSHGADVAKRVTDLTT